MKLFLLFFIAFMPLVLRAEASNDELMREMQARMVEQQIETDYKTPKTPEIEKDRAILGKKNAPIMVVAYSDFQCPYCKKGAENIEVVRKKYGDKLTYVFKNFPLPMHPYAMPAALRFAAISLQSTKKAYAFHDLVFAKQETLDTKGEVFLDEMAKKVGANLTKMKADMATDKVKAQIEADTAEAAKYEITGTPGFVVAGVLLKGAYPPEMFETIIDRRLADSGSRSIASKP